MLMSNTNLSFPKNSFVINSHKGLTLSVIASALLVSSSAFAATSYDASSEVSKTLESYSTGKINPNASEGSVIGSYVNGGNVTTNSVHGGVHHVADGKVVFYERSNALLAAETSANNVDKGASAESTARIGAYSGAALSALLISNASANVVSSRLGMGSAVNTIAMAENQKGVGFYFAPMYSNFESDSLEAGNLGYGVDLDFFGLAVGGDYTLNNNLRVGLMLNFGSGDAQGQQAAANSSTDFSYYGVSLYGGYNFGALNVSADLGYVVADNDMSVKTGYSNIGTLKGSSDAKAISFGVNAQYEHKYDRDFTLTPHVGARYTRVTLDNFSVNSNAGAIGEYDASTSSVIALPLGITMAKEYRTASGWFIKPSLDITLTAYMGDTDIDSSFAWAGALNIDSVTSTELIEDFTYGSTIGLGMRNGNFALGLGLNYTRSSSTDEYGALASARFVF